MGPPDAPPPRRTGASEQEDGYRDAAKAESSRRLWPFLLHWSWRLDMAVNWVAERTGRLVAAVHRRCHHSEPGQ